MTAKEIVIAALLLTPASTATAMPGGDESRKPSDARSAAAPETEADATTLAAVVVTARKKSEALQQVPMTVLALDRDSQQALALDNLGEIAEYVPGLQQSELAVSSRMSLRGVNSGDNNAFEQSVGVYVDGIYRGRMNQQHIGLFDLQRIEVLKGPQVTLYGNSSIGGAISAISRKPSFESGGEVRARYDFAHQEPRIEAGFDVPVNSQLALRIAGKWRDQGKGNTFNESSGNSEPASAETAARVSAQWLPSDAMTVALRYEHGKFDRIGHVFDVFMHIDGFGEPWPNSQFSGINDGRLNIGNGAPFKYQEGFVKTDMDESMIDLQYQFESWTLTSITGFSRYNYQQSLDVDITPATMINVYQDENYRQLSQELRVSGEASEHVSYLAGLYYQTDTFRNDYLSDFNLPELLAPLYGAPADRIASLISPLSRHILLDQDTRQWAAFGNVDFTLSEQWRASLGFRYLLIDKKAQQAVRPAGLDHVDSNGALVDVRWLDPALAPLLLGNPAYLADPTNYRLVLGDGTVIAPVLVPDHVMGYGIVSAGRGVIHEFDGLARTERHPMFQASLSYQWSPDLLLYANWANGAKAGGFDFLYEGGSRAEVEYDPEHANVFEIGFKKDWTRLRLNLAAFYGRYADLQVSVYDGGIGFLVGNAASSISQGLDGELEWSIGKGWRVLAQFAYLNFRYDEFTDANCSTTERLRTGAAICDWSGDATPFVPDFESALMIERSRETSTGWTVLQSLRWIHKGSHSTSSDNEAYTREPAYDLLDYRVDLTPPGKTWALAFAGKNLTNKRYNVFTGSIPLAPGGAFANVLSKGRELAIEWRTRF